MKFISGEGFQQMCDVYFGGSDDFSYNPIISEQTHKHKLLHTLTTQYNNPKLVFCYTHRLSEFVAKLPLFLNPFILVTHNSDYTIGENDIGFLENPMVLRWYSQNVNVIHHKLAWLPIGIANQQWEHGNLRNWDNIHPRQNSEKTGIYFFFNIHTNALKRIECKQILESKGLVFGDSLSHSDYLQRLASEMKYAICPEGNGVDSHRVWECFYTNTIPICIRSVHTELIAKRFPMILLDSWNDFDMSFLPNLTVSGNNDLNEFSFFQFEG